MVSARILPTGALPFVPSQSQFNLSQQQSTYKNGNIHELEDANNEASVTLSFGGVEFCLSPSVITSMNMGSSTDDPPLFSISKKPHGMQIQMSNFSGTLFVSSSSKGTHKKKASTYK